jgi:hypothetical protein
MSKKDACYNKVKAQYKVFPSARASQAIAKCRKSKGQVRKTKAGSNLKRWEKEKWKDTKTGKSCGSGGKSEYCRPTRKVSSKTPRTASSLSKSQKAAQQRRKSSGQRAKPLRRRK